MCTYPLWNLILAVLVKGTSGMEDHVMTMMQKNGNYSWVELKFFLGTDTISVSYKFG